MGQTLANILKEAREQSGYSTREVSSMLHIDQALISKFENGKRSPTRDQINQLAELLALEVTQLTLVWLKEKILREIQDEPLGLQALKAAQEEISPQGQSPLDELFQEMEMLKNKMEQWRQKGL